MLAASAATLPQVRPIRVQRAAGAAQTLPYSEDFSKMSSFDNFVVIDANQDQYTWTYDYGNQAVRYNQNSAQAADDWLLTPALKLTKSHSYELTFKYRAGFWLYAETFEVGVGKDTVTSAYKQIVPKTTTKVDTLQTMTVEFTVTDDGEYRIGFHAVSAADQYQLYIDDISVTEKASLDAPAATQYFDVTPGHKGALTAALSFKAPEVSYSGARLTSLNKVEVLRGTDVIKTFDTVVPGQQLSLTDDGAKQGINHYSVIGYNDAGKGEAAVRDAYVGIDVPEAPAVSLRATEPQGVDLTWQAPQQGEHQGYFEPDALTYSVYSQSGQSLASGLKVLTWADPSVSLTGQQRLVYYGVTATSIGGESQVGVSNPIVVGDAYGLPFHESFADGQPLPTHFFWTERSGESNFEFSTTHSIDDEYGCLEYLPKVAGDKASFNTGKIDVSTAGNPALMFAFYAYPGHPIRLSVLATTAELTDTLATYNYDGGVGDTKEWKKNVLLLDKFKGRKDVIIKFLAQSDDLAIPVYIDDINVIDYLDYNVQAQLRTFATATVGEDCMFGVKITNLGSQPATGLSVDLYVEGEKVDSHECSDLPKNYDSMQFMYYTPKLTDPDTIHVWGVVHYAQDQDLSDNTTLVGAVVVKHPTYPRVTDLTGEVIGESTVHLDWSTPADAAGGVRTDDFESYEAFKTSGYGFWTTIDGDGASTWGISDVNFTHEGEPMAFMTFNPTACGINLDWSPQFTPNSGKQYVLAMSAQSGQAKNGHNDDWLISPQLSGKAQTVSFMTKHVDTQYPEVFEVLYSTTTADTAAFKLLSTHSELLSAWTKIEAQLPEGAKYFAVHSIGKDSYALMIDDATFDAAPLTIVGYNVYCDKQVIGRTGGATNYDVTGVTAGPHDYQVTAIYTVGESSLSNVVTLDVEKSGISDVQQAQVNAVVSGNELTMQGAPGVAWIVATIDGRLIGQGTLDKQAHSLRLAPGLYVAKIGKQAFKVAVR